MAAPPALEQAMGLGAYLTPQQGIGGHLRHEPEDFRVIELGDGPRRKEGTPFTAARIRLRNWETNRFVGIASKKVGIKRNFVGFGGMKDKRAVTEQWFTFKTKPERVARLAELDDVEILETASVADRMFPGAHEGNRFILRVHGGREDVADDIAAMAETIRANGGVPCYFGPQRFGASFRPITHLVGAALVAGDLDEAVRLYLGNPMDGERHEAFEARRVFEETRDPEAALDVYPEHLDPERRMLERMARGGDMRYVLRALPSNLLTLFVHAHQSWVFNQILTARMEAGLPLNDVVEGDRVVAKEDDGTVTHLVTARNIVRVRHEVQRGRAAPTAILPGLDAPFAEGIPGEIERRICTDLGITPEDFACPELPEVASKGRRRSVLQWVDALDARIEDGVPTFSFALGRGAYATTVMREFMKADVDAY